MAHEDREQRATQADGRLGWDEAHRLANLGSWVWDGRARELVWSPEMYRIFGLDPDAGPLQLEDYWRAIHEDDRDLVATSIGRLTDEHEPLEFECRVVLPDGEIRWMHTRAEAVLDDDGRVLRLAGYAQDVTERHLAEHRRMEAQERLARHEAVLERIARNEPMADTLAGLCREIEERYPEARCSVLLVDAAGDVLHHAAAPSLPDAVVDALEGLPVAEGMGACGTAAFRRDAVVVADTLTDPLTATFVDLAVAHDLRSVWSQPLLDPDGQALGTFAVYRRVVHEPDAEEFEIVRSAAGLAGLAIERDRTVRALKAAANIDPLTGLPNRTRFLECLTDRLAESDSVAVMFLDLDRFKWINDSLGHPTGDAILVQVGARIERVLRAGDVLARFGGDEFTIMVNHADPFAVDRLALRLEGIFSAPFEHEGGEFFLSVSIGTVLAERGQDASALVRDADAAMYAAKEGGRARHVLFDEGLRRRAVSRVTLESELRRGIERDEFVMHYQPIFDVRAGTWRGVEALARWQHPTRGLLAPDAFIPLAEETGLITVLGLRLVDRILSQAATWIRMGLKVPVAANLSVVQLSDPDFPDELGEALVRHGVPAELVLAEVTETGVMEQVEVARGALEQVAELGVRILIDDFGTGYSSIARLRELPVVGVKVDRAFTQHLGEDSSVGSVLAAITDLAHALDLTVVAEGIETPAAASTASDLGCDFLQGYELARPAPADVVAGLLS